MSSSLLFFPWETALEFLIVSKFQIAEAVSMWSYEEMCPHPLWDPSMKEAESISMFPFVFNKV